MSLLAVSQVAHSHPTHVFGWFAISAGAFVAFVLLVAGAAHMANLRDDRIYGRADAFSYPDDEGHAHAAGGPSSRPWEEMYRRRGYDPEAELAGAEAASAERSAVVAAARNPIGPSGSNAKTAPDAAEEQPRPLAP